MVAARPANLPADARLASGVGSLLLGPVQIENPRWRCDAIARIAPALVHHGIVIDRLRAQLREGLRAAPCPAPLREGLGELVLGRLADAEPAALAQVITALWSRDWPTATLHAVAARLALRDLDGARALGCGHRATHQVRELLRTGCLADRFVADVRDADAFEPTVAMIEALVGARREPRVLPARDRDRAVAHLARLALHAGGIAAARQRARSLATASGRSGAFWWIARDLLAGGDFDEARDVAAEIEAPLLRQYATIELARTLVARYRYADALHALREVRDPRLAAARVAVKRIVLLCLRAPTNTLAFARPDLHRVAWTPAAWLRPFDPVRQDAITTALFLARAGWLVDDYMLIEDGAAGLGRLEHDPIARRDAIELAHQIGQPVRTTLAIAQCLRHGLDAYLAEELAIQAHTRTVAQPFRDGLAAALPPTADPRSLARALYDEGLALSPHAPRRRRVLIAASQHCLRSALVQPHDWPRATIRARLRTLVHLGGSLAADAIAKAIATLPFDSELTRTALAHLALLDPHRARDLAVPCLAELRVPVELLRQCELGGALAPGFARAFAQARRLWLKEAVVCELVTAWWRRTGELPTIAMLERIAQPNAKVPTIAELVERVAAAPEALRGEDHVAVARRVVGDPDLLADLELGAPARIDPTLRPWRSHATRNLLVHALSKQVGTVVPALVQKIARRLHPATLQPLAELEVSGVRYRVRLLDKGLDLLTYLRFADVPARSCYRSTDSFYYRHTRTNLAAAWKDPLTLCFHVERERDRAFQPCGFLFGSFADADGVLALVFNSLHVRPGSAAVREQVLRAVERIVTPFGIGRIGIANQHGGHGPLPADYVSREVAIVRHRALAIGGRLVTEIYDDIEIKANRPTRIDHLYWRTL
jgi:hypothetical protein